MPNDTTDRWVFESELLRDLEELAALETPTAEDLERYRNRLPTDPRRAELVQKALPYPYNELFEYVRGSERQSAYWRIRQDRSEPRSAADRENRERFAEAARQTEGVSGTAEYQGREIPTSAAIVADRVEGQSTHRSDENSTGQRALERLQNLLDR